MTYPPPRSISRTRRRLSFDLHTSMPSFGALASSLPVNSRIDGSRKISREDFPNAQVSKGDLVANFCHTIPKSAFHILNISVCNGTFIFSGYSGPSEASQA
jgi:hypothetical protein